MKAIPLVSTLFILCFSLLANPEPDTWYYILSDYSDLYLDVQGGGKENRTPIWQYSKNCTAAQQWQFKEAGGGYYYLESRVSGLVMEVSGGNTSPETAVQQYERNGTDAQKWLLEQAGTNKYRIKSKLNGYYLEVKDASTEIRATIQVNTRNNNNAQTWIVHPVEANEIPSPLEKISYLGNYPDENSPGWHVNTQGISHDEAYWYITQEEKLWKIPVSRDLKAPFWRYVPGQGIIEDIPEEVTRIEMPSQLKELGYNHFGDLDYWNGYLFIPLEIIGGDKKPAMGIFNSKDLSFVKRIPMDTWLTQASWCAIDPVRRLLYMSNNESVPIYRFEITMEQGEIALELYDTYSNIKLNDCTELNIGSVQGGTISPNGKYLFLLNGYYTDFDERRGGIWVIDIDRQEMVAKSFSVLNLEHHRPIDRKLTPLVEDFKYEFHPHYTPAEEPEGITFWNLENENIEAPGFGGHLHALLLDNDWPNSDDIYIKHYNLDPVTLFTEGAEEIEENGFDCWSMIGAGGIADEWSRERLNYGFYGQDILAEEDVTKIRDAIISLKPRAQDGLYQVRYPLNYDFPKNSLSFKFSARMHVSNKKNYHIKVSLKRYPIVGSYKEKVHEIVNLYSEDLTITKAYGVLSKTFKHDFDYNKYAYYIDVQFQSKDVNPDQLILEPTAALASIQICKVFIE